MPLDVQLMKECKDAHGDLAQQSQALDRLIQISPRSPPHGGCKECKGFLWDRGY